jgi:hypothetical protein
MAVKKYIETETEIFNDRNRTENRKAKQVKQSLIYGSVIMRDKR